MSAGYAGTNPATSPTHREGLTQDRAPKPDITSPFARLPQECLDALGQHNGIHDTEHKGKRAFLLLNG